MDAVVNPLNTTGKRLRHETLEMIRVYTRLAEADLAAAHRTASPVENWRL